MTQQYKRDRSKCGIIFVHGIVGNNRIFEFLRQCISDEFETVNVTLKGHGGNALSFSQASMKEWKVQVEETVDYLCLRCDTIIGVGHSMGCLLLLEQARKGRLSSLFLMNPPMRISIKFGLLKNIFKVATGLTREDRIAQAAKDAYGVSLDLNPVHYYGWPKRYFELFREIRRINCEVIPHVECRAMVAFSYSDELVNPKSVEVFSRLAQLKLIPLLHSTHYYYSENDRSLLMHYFSILINCDLDSLIFRKGEIELAELKSLTKLT